MLAIVEKIQVIVQNQFEIHFCSEFTRLLSSSTKKLVFQYFWLSEIECSCPFISFGFPRREICTFTFHWRFSKSYQTRLHTEPLEMHFSFRIHSIFEQNTTLQKNRLKYRSHKANFQKIINPTKQLLRPWNSKFLAFKYYKIHKGRTWNSNLSGGRSKTRPLGEKMSKNEISRLHTYRVYVLECPQKCKQTCTSSFDHEMTNFP